MTLLADGIRYHDGTAVDPLLSPRPYLTVATLGGVPVTDVEPEDHLHHLGVSVAIPDVNGTTFWGGRTFVRDEGSQLLPNHGRQEVRGHERTPSGFVERVAWRALDGTLILDEERTVDTRVVDDGLEVRWSSALTASTGEVSFGSPQTNGRPGAFYGGIFWRAPFPTARVRSAAGEGADAAHGSSSPWLAVDGAGASLVATTLNTDMPWFIRAAGYVGFGPAVAVDGRRVLAAGETLLLDLRVAVLDEPPAGPAAVAQRLRA